MNGLARKLLFEQLEQKISSATWNQGDLNGDGLVSLADLDLAFAQYGLALNVVA